MSLMPMVSCFFSKQSLRLPLFSLQNAACHRFAKNVVRADFTRSFDELFDHPFYELPTRTDGNL
jgi:hypothetical protein